MKTKCMGAAALLTTLALTPPSGGATAPPEVEQLRSSVEAMQKAMNELSTQLAATQARLDQIEKSKTASAVTSLTMPLVMPLDALPPEIARVSDYQSFSADQAAAPRVYNFPLEPGLDAFMPVFNTKTVLKLGGYIRLDAIADDDNNGNPNQWVPSSFPINEPDSGARAQIHTKASRFTLELRRPVNEDRLRIFYENDFFNNSSGSSMDYRVRHMYGQASNILVGQTFSTFMDIDAWPDTLDYGGPNGLVNKRQAQIRWTAPLTDNMSWAFALEQPGFELTTAGLPTGATGVNRLPDLTSAWRWEGEKAGHFQVAGILRELRYERAPAAGSSALGWGLSLSGVLSIFGDDKIYGQAVYGEGISHYLNDTGGLGLDASLDPSNDFTALPAVGLVAGYTHLWGEQWRSTISYGYAGVDSEPRLGALAFDHTHYGSVNLTWQPAKSFRVGLEGLYGQKVTQGGAESEGYRINFVFKYDVVK